MALVIYPTDGYDSFCSVPDAKTLLDANVPAAQLKSWTALVNTDKEVYLRQATLLIKQDIILPYTLEDDLKLATAYLANNSVGVNMLDEDDSGLLKSKRIEGVIEKEWFAPRSDSNSFPDIVNSLIEQYRASSSGSFTFCRK